MNTKYNDLDTLLILALTLKNHDHRAMQKKALKLFKRVQPVIVGALLKPICHGTAAQGSKALELFVEDYLYYAEPAREIGDLGYTGMAIVDKEVAIPVSMVFGDEEDYHWARANQQEVLTAICKDLLWDAYQAVRSPYQHKYSENGTEHYLVVPHDPLPVKADILLFGSRGFSGEPKHWGLELLKDEPLFLTELVSGLSDEGTFRFRPTKDVA